MRMHLAKIEIISLGTCLAIGIFGFFLVLAAVDIKVNRKFPLETKDNLNLKRPQDALSRIIIEPAEQLNLSIQKLTYEFLYTNLQDTHGIKMESMIFKILQLGANPFRIRNIIS